MKNLQNSLCKRNIVTLNWFQGLAKKGLRLKSAVLDYRVLGKLNVSLAQGLCFASAPSKSAKSQMLKQVRHDNKRIAFTLAEVLITLGIIGVIAAITIPAVIQNTQSQETVVKLKKAYNTLKMVERQATVDHGPMSEWAWTGTLTDFETFFKPYFDIMKDCGTGTGCFGKERYYLKGTVQHSSIDDSTNYYKFITPDGTSFYYLYSAGTGVARKGAFWVDINGPKGPNKMGRDFFEFNVFPTLGIKPSGTYDETSITPLSSATVDTECSATGNGWYCAAKVLSENAINY